MAARRFPPPWSVEDIGGLAMIAPWSGWCSALMPDQQERIIAPCRVRRGPKMKKQEDARLAILREYDRWAKDQPKDAKKMGGFVFFGYLEKERPDLLDFRAASKWQIVHLWLRHGGRLKD
jgi:hypothetical protein